MAAFEIATARLVIREFEKDDWKPVHTYARKGKHLKYLPWGPNKVADTKAYIQQAIDDYDAEPRMKYEFAVTLRESALLIGSVAFRINKNEPTSGEFGYVIHPDQTGNGYATEAARALLYYMRAHHGIQTVTAECYAENLASFKVLEKCGLREVLGSRKKMDLKGVQLECVQFKS